ncbi:Fc.00g114850.m01.CDS01 [Cosmosporella sp. VM-42]
MRQPPSLRNDSAIRRLDERTYAVELTKAFCVGTVPNGGYVASIFLRVASDYLAPRNQPDPIAAHWQFLNATHAGPAVVLVEEAKIGRGMSVVHLTLFQDDLLEKSPWVSSKTKKQVVAYITNGRLETEKGVTLPTRFEITPTAPPVDFGKLVDGKDVSWKRLHMTLMVVVPMLHNIEFYAPRAGHPLPTTYDLWMRLANGERFTASSLGYVSDAGPPLLVESFRPEDPDAAIPEGGFAFNKVFWYPTVTMSLEVKKKLPEEGEEWLRLRVVAKLIQNGRYDAEVIIFDSKGDIVALSNHVALAVDGERNFSRQKKL